VRGLIDRMTRKGPRGEDVSLRGFLLLYIVAAFKPLRPRSLRYQAENAHLEEWLASCSASPRRTTISPSRSPARATGRRAMATPTSAGARASTR
jgi:hypothetical protein